MRKYIVIGASGMLGLKLARNISRDSANEVIGTWRSFELSGEKFRTVSLDLADESVGGLIREFQPDIVFHTASETDIDLCEKKPELVYHPIQTGLFSLIDSCNETGGKLVFISSDGIFGRNDGEHYEDSLPTPINMYGRAKVLSEGLIRSMCQRWIIVRCCPVGYHPLRERKFVRWIETQIYKKNTMTGWTDCLFTPLTATTLADKLLQLQEIENRIVHLHSFPQISKYDFLCRMVEIYGASPDRLVRPGIMADADIKTPRPKSQVLCSQDIPGIETAVPIEKEFEIIRAENFTLRDQA